MKLRFAPSPTGYLHLGNTRTALINWLFARSGNGQFLLRMDDTDLERSRPEYESQIIEDFKWLGLSHDQYVKQSDRLELYASATDKLKKSGRLYPCYETSEELALQRKQQTMAGKPPRYNRASLNLSQTEIDRYESEGRRPHWRFKLDEGEISWDDMVRGKVVIRGEEMSDPVLIREDGSPVYTLASCVDDLDLEVTHILRGEDHVTNTAVQIQLFEALGGNKDSIIFGHMALISGGGGEALSKREGSLSIKDLKEQGMEPMAILSQLAKIGTSDAVVPYTHLDDLVKSFDIAKFSRSTPKLSIEELWALNSKIVQQYSWEEVSCRMESLGVPNGPEFWNLVRGNLDKFEDISEWAETLFNDRSFSVSDKSFIETAKSLLPESPWNQESPGLWLDTIKAQTGRKGKDLFMPIRMALTGMEHGPDIKQLIYFMGRDLVLSRLNTVKEL